MIAALVLVLGLAVAVIATLWVDLRDLRKKLRGEQMRADAATADAARARASKNRADQDRERAVLGYGEVLSEVAEVAAYLRANHEPFVAKRLQRLVEDRLGTLRRPG